MSPCCGKPAAPISASPAAAPLRFWRPGASGGGAGGTRRLALCRLVTARTTLATGTPGLSARPRHRPCLLPALPLRPAELSVSLEPSPGSSGRGFLCLPFCKRQADHSQSPLSLAQVPSWPSYLELWELLSTLYLEKSGSLNNCTETCQGQLAEEAPPLHLTPWHLTCPSRFQTTWLCTSVPCSGLLPLSCSPCFKTQGCAFPKRRVDGPCRGPRSTLDETQPSLLQGAGWEDTALTSTCIYSI